MYLHLIKVDATSLQSGAENCAGLTVNTKLGTYLEVVEAVVSKQTSILLHRIMRCQMCSIF